MKNAVQEMSGVYGHVFQVRMEITYHWTSTHDSQIVVERLAREARWKSKKEVSVKMEIVRVRIPENDLVLIYVKEHKDPIAVRVKGSTDLQDVVIGFYDEEKKQIYY